MNILLLSAYHTPSHRYWCDGLVSEFPEHTWTCLILPPRFFAWRVRGNPLSWSYLEQEALSKDYDLIVATSMVDVATLKGLNPALAHIPVLLYFHENQFEYPQSTTQVDAIAAQMTSVYSALAARGVAFNSEFNRTSFFSGLARLLKKLPDQVPKGIVEEIRRKSFVLPVPLSSMPVDFQQVNKKRCEFELVWNHRWEYDKGPDRLLAFAQALPSGLKLKVHVVGQQFRSVPKEFNQIEKVLSEKNYAGCFGYLESRSEYFDLLNGSDAVLSTALHDFQGLSIMEGVRAGCVPIVPDRLAYTEFFQECYRYPSNINDIAGEAKSAVAMLMALLESEDREAPELGYLSWSSQRSAYQTQIHRCVDSKTFDERV